MKVITEKIKERRDIWEKSNEKEKAAGGKITGSREGGKERRGNVQYARKRKRKICNALKCYTCFGTRHQFVLLTANFSFLNVL